MPISQLKVSRGLGNSTFVGSISKMITQGFSIDEITPSINRTLYVKSDNVILNIKADNAVLNILNDDAIIVVFDA